MSKNPFQHVDLRVRDKQAAVAFYSKVLPAVGFTVDEGGELFRCFSAGGTPPDVAWYGFTENKDHRPNTNRIAFRAASREEVDRAGQIVREAGGRNISGPRECPEYSPSYYAVFFEDPSGNCLEVCHLTD
jgi:predicted enzyme related to lactoylglutathione lyase